MSLTGDIIGALLADAGVAAQVGARIYVQSAPQGAAEPYITVSPISGPTPMYHVGGPTGLERARYQLDAWCSRSGDRDAVIAALQSMLSGLSGELVSGGTSVSMIGFSVISQPFETPKDGSERGTFRAICEINFTFS